MTLSVSFVAFSAECSHSIGTFAPLDRSLLLNPMPPKKGRKGKKKVLDPAAAERARIEETERRRRQLTLFQARLKEIIEEEKRMTATSVGAIEARWITFLRECKQKELIADIEVVKRGFQLELDRRNVNIENLFTELDEVEEQYRHALVAHMEVSDSLIELHHRHTEELRREFEDDLFQMKRDFELERAELEKNHKLEMTDLQLILQNMATEAEILERKLQEETSEVHETALEKMEEEKKQMQADLTTTSEAIRSELDARYKEFMATAQVNMKDYMDKSKEDQETTERIASQLKKIDKLQEGVTSWRTNIARNAREWEQRNSAIQAEKDATFKHLKQLKRRMQLWRQKEARALVDLLKNAKLCETTLESTATKAERILRLIGLCKPLETEREQVLSFEANESPQEIEDDVRRRLAADEPGALLADKDVPNGPAAAADWQFLERFWTKHNKVMLDCAAISQEYYHLKAENEQLQRILKQYLDDISVNDNVMKSNNALLLANPAPNVVQAVGKALVPTGEFAVIEGNKFMADTARQMNPL